MSTDPTIQELRSLVVLISQSLDTIEHSTTAHSTTFPPLREPFTQESEVIRSLPEVAGACNVLISAAGQLIASVRSPGMSALVTGLQYEVSSAMRTAIQLHVPEILKQTGPEGLHVKEIAAYTHVDHSKLARVLRLLAANHIFIEVSPDVFAHNRISSTLDSGKPVAQVLQDLTAKHDGTLGTAALFEQLADHGLKASSYLYESLVDERTRGSSEACDAAFSFFSGTTDISYFEWIHGPGNEYQRKRFDIAMDGAQKLAPPSLIYKGFDWSALPSRSVVVDVGGGVGSQVLVLAKELKQLDFIVQDRERTVADGEEFFKKEFPDALVSGRVKFQAHDFFAPQPVHAPSIFFLRRILHDWSDEDCVRILRQLRDVAGPNTQLMILDTIMSYVCEEPLSYVPGAEVSSPPAPLLSNGGYAYSSDYMVDLAMMTLHNGVERTLPQFQELLAKSRWQLSRVHRMQGFLSKIIAKPATGETTVR